ncbi:MAG: hypothetical protein U0792_18860 [Gemmataceae bacterium]
MDLQFVRRGRKPRHPEDDHLYHQLRHSRAFGLIFIKTRQSNPEFPTLELDGFTHIGTLVHDAPAPLEVAMDNFNEIEHSGTVHKNFGYDLDRMHDVKVSFESTDDSVTVKNEGPTKTLPFLDRLFIGVKKDDIFYDHWTTWFSPLYSRFDHWWTSADGTQERKPALAGVSLLCPGDRHHDAGVLDALREVAVAVRAGRVAARTLVHQEADRDRDRRRHRHAAIHGGL